MSVSSFLMLANCFMGGSFLDLNSSALRGQGFPILKDRTATEGQKGKSLLDVGVKEAHLSSHIANTNVIHQAQHSAVRLSQQTGNGSRARSLSCITIGAMSASSISLCKAGMWGSLVLAT
jgi:hypothetical protein